MTTQSSVPYIMDDPREAARLELKVDPETWVHKYMAHRVWPGANVLCVGCGPGVLVQKIAELDQSIKATGIDISESRIQVANEKNRNRARVRFICGDAHAMKLPSSSFDLVYSRMLFQYLQRKESALAEMVRVCKPGGTVLLQDLDGQLLWHYPEDAELLRGLEKVVAALAKTGFDPFVGRKLFRLAHLAGLENIAVQVESYHLIAGEADPATLEQWKLKLDIALPQIKQAMGSEQEATEAVNRFLAYLRRPDSLTYSTVFTVTGEKPL